MNSRNENRLGIFYVSLDAMNNCYEDIQLILCNFVPIRCVYEEEYGRFMYLGYSCYFIQYDYVGEVPVYEFNVDNVNRTVKVRALKHRCKSLVPDS